MNRLVLANVDYQRHATDEGNQLQEGLRHAGWALAGAGYGDGCRDVPTLLERHRPEIVVIQDRRDWDPASDISFRKDIGFHRLGVLASRSDIVKVVVVKDAGSSIDYHRAFAEEVRADALLTYYHDRSVETVAPWMAAYTKVRTWHTVDADDVAKVDLAGWRDVGLVSGAVSAAYPLRRMAMEKAKGLRLDALKHPGYGNRGAHTPEYLRKLAGYRVHVATASRYHFALRKIIESVACGCIPITNLPAYDVLPEIDGALVRVADDVRAGDLADAINVAERTWDQDKALAWSRRAVEWYDYRAMGARLDASLCALKVAANANDQ